jgi:hypothetical protein
LRRLRLLQGNSDVPNAGWVVARCRRRIDYFRGIESGVVPDPARRDDSGRYAGDIPLNGSVSRTAERKPRPISLSAMPAGPFCGFSSNQGREPGGSMARQLLV